MNTTELNDRIRTLKAQHNAVILAHNYCLPEIQDIADFVGDSLQLSIRAQEISAPVIVFCGVRFMAETAKILSPGATVLLPVSDAGCPMADMANAEDVAAFRAAHPDHILVAYVNSTADVKAEVDLCVTSANAEKIVASLPPEKPVLFLPDRNLGKNVSQNISRKMDLWPGFCPIHDAITVEMVNTAKQAHPGALFLCHPECRPEVVALADRALSTGGMISFLRESPATEFIIGTECGIFHRLQLENPQKKLWPLSPLPACADMKKISLSSVCRALETLSPRIELPAALMDRARTPIERMLARSK